MNYGLIALIIAGGIWMCFVFFGFITGTGKAFKKTPTSASAQAAQTKAQGQQFTEDTASKQQAMMEKIRDTISNNRKD